MQRPFILVRRRRHLSLGCHGNLGDSRELHLDGYRLEFTG
jgi:hypothetical protein